MFNWFLIASTPFALFMVWTTSDIELLRALATFGYVYVVLNTLAEMVSE